MYRLTKAGSPISTAISRQKNMPVRHHSYDWLHPFYQPGGDVYNPVRGDVENFLGVFPFFGTVLVALWDHPLEQAQKDIWYTT
jgi:hypothetical protein